MNLGRNSTIGKNCIFEGLQGIKGTFSFGDHCRIHDNCRFYIQKAFSIGDYANMHHNCLVSGYRECKIGHNPWIGQNCIINCTDKLTIGDNFVIGAYSKVWTHAVAGDLLNGCRIIIGVTDIESKSGRVDIGDDFWGIGSVTISPGITIGNKVIALTNSLITHDIPDNTIVAGSPAKPMEIDGDLKAYVDLTDSEKFSLMKNFSKEFSKLKQVQIKINDSKKLIQLGNREIIIDCEDNTSETTNNNPSYFHILKRTYTKKHNPLEIDFMNFLVGYRAKFVPE